MGEPSWLRKAWLSSVVRTAIEGLQPEKKQKNHKATPDGYLAISSRDLRMMQLKKFESTSTSKPCVILQDKSHNIVVEFTKECAQNIKETAGKPITSFPPGSIIQIQEYELVLQGTDAEQFWGSSKKKGKRRRGIEQDEVTLHLTIHKAEMKDHSGHITMADTIPIMTVDDVQQTLARFLKKIAPAKDAPEGNAETAGKGDATDIKRSTSRALENAVGGKTKTSKPNRATVEEATELMGYHDGWGDFRFDADEYIIPKLQLEKLEERPAWFDLRFESVRRAIAKENARIATQSTARSNPTPQPGQGSSKADVRPPTNPQSPLEQRSRPGAAVAHISERLIGRGTPPSTAGTTDEPLDWESSPERPRKAELPEIHKSTTPPKLSSTKVPAVALKTPPRGVSILSSSPSNPSSPPSPEVAVASQSSKRETGTSASRCSTSSTQLKVATRLILSAVVMPARAKIPTPKAINAHGGVAVQRFGLLNAQNLQLYKHGVLKVTSTGDHTDDDNDSDEDEEEDNSQSSDEEPPEEDDHQQKDDEDEHMEDDGAPEKVSQERVEDRSSVVSHLEASIPESSPVLPTVSQIGASFDPEPASSLLKDVEAEVAAKEEIILQQDDEIMVDQDSDNESIGEDSEQENDEKAGDQELEADMPKDSQSTESQNKKELLLSSQPNAPLHSALGKIEVYQTQVESSGSTSGEVSVIMETPMVRGGSEVMETPMVRGSSFRAPSSSAPASVQTSQRKHPGSSPQQDVEMPDADSLESQESKSSGHPAQRTSPLPAINQKFRETVSSSPPQKDITSRKRRASAIGTVQSPERRPVKQPRIPSPSLSPVRTRVVIDLDSSPHRSSPQLQDKLRNFRMESTPRLHTSTSESALKDASNFKKPAPVARPSKSQSQPRPQITAISTHRKPAAASALASPQTPSPTSASSRTYEKLSRIPGWDTLKAPQQERLVNLREQYHFPSNRLVLDNATVLQRKEMQQRALDFLREPNQLWEDHSAMPLSKFIHAYKSLKLVKHESEEATREKASATEKKSRFALEMERERLKVYEDMF